MNSDALRNLLTADERDYVDRAIAAVNSVLPEAPPSLQAKARTLGFKLNRRVHRTDPPHGQRTIADVAGLIKSCVQRIQAAERECPSDADYQAALKAEQEAYALWQQMKRVKTHDPDGTWSMKVIRQKHTYQEAKAQRVEIGGRIVDAGATTHRMYDLMTGEMAGLPQIMNEQSTLRVRDVVNA